MLDPDKALEIVENTPPDKRRETVPIVEACGRVLGEALAARVDSPPFSKAAMDGYALRSAEFGGRSERGAPGVRLRLVETIAAGQVPRRAVGAGECSKIMTGAMLPEGADTIVRVEFAEEADGWVSFSRAELQANIIERGENLKAGEPLLGPGLLTAQDVGVLASQGIEAVPVALAPLVGIITTGSELRSVGEELGSGEIYNSNGPQLCAQVAAMGGRHRYYGTVPDDPAALCGMLELAFQDCDLLLLSGGVSMGDLDFVPEVLEKLGAELIFHKLAIKPGKPTLFARRERAYVFGLPGNPVSTFVIFEVFVKAFLYRRMGIAWKPRSIRGTLSETIRRLDADRLEYRPVRLEAGRVHPLAYHGSSHLSALRQAEALLRIEIGVRELPEGSPVDVRLL